MSQMRSSNARCLKCESSLLQVLRHRRGCGMPDNRFIETVLYGIVKRRTEEDQTRDGVRISETGLC